MNEETLFHLLLATSFLASAACFIALFFFPAPYGRHLRGGFGPTIPFRLGWMLMEMPAPLVFGSLFFIGNQPRTGLQILFLGLWFSHYLPRAFVTPITMRGRGKRIPVVIVGLGFAYNSINGYLNGRFLFWFSSGFAADWWTDPRFVVGMSLFLGGAVVNRVSDFVLQHLRKPGESGYGIPRGGLFSFVSCPNYLGEIIEWLGWALMTWSLAGLAFATMSMANLIPRARTHHAWYQQHFPDYPQRRKALIPGVW